MLKVLISVVFFLLMCVKLGAQTLTLEGVPLHQIHEDNTPIWSTPEQMLPATPQSARVADKKFWSVTLGLHTLMIADGISTFDVRKRCIEAGYTCTEKNPLIGFFVEAGPIESYLAGTAAEAAVMYAAYKMKGSKNKLLRNTWFVVPSAIMFMHAKGFVANYRLARPGEVSSIKLEDLR